MRNLSWLFLIPITLSGACSSEDTNTNRRPLLAVLCDPSACGPNAPLAPNYACADGALAGPACVEVAPGQCTWQILDCDDPDACTNEECGPAPGEPNWICEDGTIGGPACVRVNAVCAWQEYVCGESDPDTGCSGGASGTSTCECADPAPLAPNYLCGDGQTIAGPACEATSANTCGWVIHACP